MYLRADTSTSTVSPEKSGRGPETSPLLYQVPDKVCWLISFPIAALLAKSASRTPAGSAWNAASVGAKRVFGRTSSTDDGEINRNENY